MQLEMAEGALGRRCSNESTYAAFVNKLGDRFSEQLYEQVGTIQDVKPKPTAGSTFGTLWLLHRGVVCRRVMFCASMCGLTKLPEQVW